MRIAYTAMTGSPLIPPQPDASEPPRAAQGISTKSYLYALVAVVVISLAGIMGLALYSDYHSSLRQERARLATLSKLIANNTSTLLERNRERLIGIGKRPEVQAMDPARCGTLFADLRLMFPEFANLATVDLNGSAPCSAVPQPGGKPVSVAKTEWFKRAMTERRFLVGKPFIGPITGRTVSVMVEPVWGANKELRGFLGLPLDLESYNPRIPEGSLPAGARYGFISGDGFMFWRNTDPEKLIGKYVGDQEGPNLAIRLRDGEAETIGTDNVSRYYAFVSIPQADWIVFIGVPSQSITNNVIGTAKHNAMIGAVALVAIAILLGFLLRRIDASERDLLKARDAAEAANRAKSVFLATMSHELRTPLNAILGFAELMTHDQGMPETQRENMATISRSGHHLLTLINDILEISKIEAGHLKAQSAPCDLHELVETVVDSMELRAHQAGLELTLEVAPEVPRFVQSDSGKLRQILINLLSNAIKFTRQGGVYLDVAVTRERGRDQSLLLSFVVRDTGIGIAPADLDGIFRPFVQTDQGARASEGTGLGLTIARQYAELLGGSLTAVSEQGKGSTFTLRLPVALAAPAESAEPLRRVLGVTEGQPHWRVLVVEDKIDNQRLLEQLLQHVGFEVQLAENGQEAIAAFQSWRPHFIWMDMRMPVMDGYEATRRIRALPGGHVVKIVALTASAFREDREGMLTAGCDDVLPKPIEEDKLFEMMGRLLGVSFEYAQPVAAETVAAETEATDISDLSGLPIDMRRELMLAADQLDIEATKAAIKRIRGVDASLADQLTSVARAFRFDRIVAACNQTSRQP